MACIGATLFSGGGGVEARLTSAIDFRYAIEYDPQIAVVYRANFGSHVQVARVEDVDYSQWGILDYLHASPVCKEYSQAKNNRAEGESDLQAATAVMRCMEATQPRVFTLENVGAYQHGQAFRLICAYLNHAGYMWHYEVVNAADYGVPQTRRRLILRAVLGALLPPLPQPEPWIGWHAAIEDLIPSLPESRFAPWQLARLPEELSESIVMRGENTAQARGRDYRRAPEPIETITCSNGHRAFIVSNAATEYSNGIRDGAEPMLSITTQTGSRTRAWLVGGGNTNKTIVDSKPRAASEPSFTVTYATTRDRAWLSAGRVVKMTPRALARFQSFPDSYVLPDRASLACTVIGNAVASLMMQKIVEPLLN